MNLEHKINTLIESIGNKGLFILKGFNNLFKLNYSQIYFDKIIDVNIINLINNNDKLNISQLMIKFSRISSVEEKYVIDYETFLLIDKNIINLLNELSFPISIINNNLFFRYYPIIDDINNKMLLEIDNNKSDKTINSIYSEYNSIDGKISAVYSELNIDFDIPTYDLFVDKNDFVFANNNEEANYIFNDNESVLCSNILSIM